MALTLQEHTLPLSHQNNWEKRTNYFDYPVEIRKIIYTTNTIENLNRGMRKYTKTKVQFPLVIRQPKKPFSWPLKYGKQMEHDTAKLGPGAPSVPHPL
ncbi:MAG: transposase [Bacteroidota bacterium]|nr:transposase [Bacteroidota bacterium]